MASMYECPRCGAGIRPDDTQCGRCGESLKKQDPASKAEVPASVTVNSVFSDRRTSVRMESASSYYSLSEMKAQLEEREQRLEERERDLKDREKEILGALEEIENDTLAMEEAISHYEEDRTELQKREGVMKQREHELDVLLKEHQDQRRRMEAVIDSLKVRGYRLEDLDSLVREKDRIRTTIEEERARLEEEFERKISESTKRLQEMEAGLEEEFEGRVAEALRDMAPKEAVEEKRPRDVPVAAPGLNIDQLLASMSSELDAQIGTGSEGVEEVATLTTGNVRLDEIMGGGLSQDQVILINGQPGTMKSTLAYYMIQKAAVQGKRSMYFSLEQTRESLLRQMDGVGIEANEDVIVVDMVDLRKGMEGQDGDWRDILKRYVKNVHSERSLDLFVLDSMAAFNAMTEFSMGRQELKDYFDWLREMGMTVVLIGESRIREGLADDQGEMYLSDGVIELIMKELDNQRVQRWLRVVKMRGQRNDTRYYMFKFDDGNLEISTPLAQPSFGSGTFS